MWLSTPYTKPLVHIQEQDNGENVVLEPVAVKVHVTKAFTLCGDNCMVFGKIPQDLANNIQKWRKENKKEIPEGTQTSTGAPAASSSSVKKSSATPSVTSAAKKRKAENESASMSKVRRRLETNFQLVEAG